MLDLVRIKERLTESRWSKTMPKGMRYTDEEIHDSRLWEEGQKPSVQLDGNPTPGYAILSSPSPVEVILRTSISYH